MIQLHASTYQSPIGPIELLSHNDRLCYLDFADNPERLITLMTRRYGKYEVVQSKDHDHWHQRLDRYFAGEKNAFDGILLETGGTAFQEKVWQSLREIPRGETLDYSSLAARAGNSRAVRAAASSNARNPISIVIPCHRVIGKDGSLRGYAGGEYRKQWLLEFEGAWKGPMQQMLLRDVSIQE